MPKKVTKIVSPALKKKSPKGSKIEETLLQNMVELQKIHTDLAEKFDSLAKEISSLLALFEMTARNFAKNAPIGEMQKDKEFLEKIDKLLDQNKTLAKGLMIVEERFRERVYGPDIEKGHKPASPLGNRPLPRF